MSVMGEVDKYVYEHPEECATIKSLVADFKMHRTLFDTERDFENALMIIIHTRKTKKEAESK